MDAAGERVTDLVGPASQGQGHDDQVAGRALNQGRACAGHASSDDEVAFPVARDHPVGNVRAFINQPHADNGGFAPACGGFLAHPPARRQANAVRDERLLGALPGHLRCSPSVLSPIRPIRTPEAGDLTAHHRGATPNQVGDTRLRQARIHPRHDRRIILNTQRPTTDHNQPFQ